MVSSFPLKFQVAIQSLKLFLDCYLPVVSCGLPTLRHTEPIITMNGHMGISCFERNGSFACIYGSECYSSRVILSSWRPAQLYVKSGKKIRTCGLRIKALAKEENGSCNRLVFEKEFEFKPSFVEYLKAMESVKTGREKKQGNSRESDTDTLPSLGMDRRGTNSRRYKGFKETKAIENDELVEFSDGVVGEHKYRKKGMREFNGRLTSQERSVIASRRHKQGGVIRSARWPNNQTRNMDSELQHFNLGKKTRKARDIPVESNDNQFIRSTDRVKKKFVHDKDSSELLGGKRMIIKEEDVAKGGNKLNDILVSNYIQDSENFDKAMIQRKGLVKESNHIVLEKGDGGALEMERAAFKHLHEAHDVIGKLRVPRAKMEERIQALAKRLNGADIDMPEWMFSKMIRSAKIKYTDHSILRIIQIMGKLGNWRRVLQVIEWLQMRERFKSHNLRKIYTTALDVLGKARRPVEALNVFRTMQEQMASYPDLVAYHCIAVTLGQAGYMKELFDVIDTMRSPPKKKFKTGVLGKWDPRLEPDIVVYNAVLNACVRRQQWEGAFWVLQQLKQQGQQPSIATYGLIMEVMLVCGKYNLVHEFFRKMQKSSLPNALAYKVIVNTFWREGKIEESVLAVQEMERRGIVGSAALYYDLARCLCSAGRCQEALAQMEKICKVGTKPLVITYTGLIQACLDSGNIQNAVYIFDQMKHFCPPNLVTCNIMLKAYLEHGLFEEAKELFHKMAEDGNHINSESDYKVRVLPDIYSFNTMLDACVEARRWDDFEYVYKRMLRHGYHFNTKRHLRMILDASRAGKKQLLETTWQHLARAKRSPPPSLIKERFCMMLDKDDYDSALACITVNPVEGSWAFSKSAWLNLFKENAQRFQKDTLARLMNEARLVADGNKADSVLQNMLSSGSEFLRTCSF